MSTQERIDALNAEMFACSDIAGDKSKTEAERTEALLRIQALSKEITAALATLNDAFIAHVHEVNDAFIADVRGGVVPQQQPPLRWDIQEL